MGLFLLMLRVPLATAHRAIAVKNLLARDYRLGNYAYEAARLHITLFNLGHEMSAVRAAWIERTAVSIATPAFEIEFNRVASWPDALVLLGENRPTLIAFRRELGTALKLRSSGFTPHITLMRGPTAVEEQQIEALRWTVDDFAFVHSVDGRYVELGRWKLTPPAAS